VILFPRFSVRLSLAGKLYLTVGPLLLMGLAIIGVVRISLRPEEAVLGNCKTSSSAGPVGGSCAAVSPCMSIGS